MPHPFKIPEVVDHIIDYFHDDPGSLRSCALVAKSWLASSRFHLFGCVVVESEGGLLKLYRFIKAKDNLGQLIRSIRLTLALNRPTFPPSSPVFRHNNRKDTLLDMISLIHTTPTLTAFAVENFEWPEEIVYPEIRPTYANAFSDLTLSGCAFRTREDFLSCLQAFPSTLENLHVDLSGTYHYVHGGGTTFPVPDGSTLSVGTLRLRQNQAAIDGSIFNMLDKHSPRRLYLETLEGWTMNGLPGLLQSTGSQISHLEVALMPLRDHDALRDDNSPFEMASLRTLVISLVNSEGGGAPAAGRRAARLVSDFLHLVDAIRAPNLESLHVDFRRVGEKGMAAAAEGGLIDWEHVRRALRAVRGSPLGGLPWVTVLLDVNWGNSGSIQAIQSGLRELEDDGVISYSF